MSTHKRLVLTIVLAGLWAAAAGQVQANPADSQPAGRAATTAAEHPTTAAELTAGQIGAAAMDKPNDNGVAVMVTWNRLPIEGPQVAYEILIADTADGPFQSLFTKPQPSDDCLLKSHFPASFGLPSDHIPNKAFLPAARCQCANCRAHAFEVSRDAASKALTQGTTYFFKVRALRDGAVIGESAVVSAAPISNWFGWHRLNVLIATIVLSIIVMGCVFIAKRNPTKLFIRRIGGLDAMDEAIGRATEMGKPVFYCYGMGSIGDVTGISTMNLLAKISERVAENGAEMKVTCMDYLVLQVSQDSVKQSFSKVGRPDAYRQDNIYYVTGDAFAYAVAVGNTLIREKAGTVFFMGAYGPESLLLSETGAVTKAIQIAGTDSFMQIPFFITTCDYTLIGEELYAASACLSHEPRLVGSVKGQDAVKSVILVLVLVGTVLATAGLWAFSYFFWPLG